MKSMIAAMPLVLAACSGASDAQVADTPRTLSVSGEGVAVGTPDLAMLTFAVETTGTTAKEAMSDNANRLAAVRDELKGLGVEARDMQTTGFSLNPNYDYDKNNRRDRNKIVGYTARNGLFVRLRDVEKAGEAIDKAVTAGANRLDSLSFGFQEPGKLKEQAQRDAVRNARAVAELMAEEAGVRLGPVLSMSMSSHSPSPRPMMMQSRAMAADVAPTPVEAGESALNVSVHMKFGLK